ncbi:AbrB family transcriptional regulator [Tropicibacter naphthalenivorans]|uniref:Membrane protein AbrB duplication n=1 Tax=Tropicibacter naphthalenivorans TaxID=441103 RepID=A0A0P1G6Q3_9RHOB|nr:AbrB family transcriptional regulator [Tropicibacter naphthalenivorans]CUH77259.1 membrane protein AbrB duplication [Tropicibacter naphthalenivorans]SMC59514.1 hypothetical protein SAMN04488093_102241 [Tropicibacter naphthalenivorans]
MLTRLSFALIWKTALLLAIGAGGGWSALHLGLPLPWMIGGLSVSAALVLMPWRLPVLDGYSFPMGLRTLFVTLIGVMIGTQVTPDLLSLAGKLPLTMGFLFVFVLVAHAGNFAIFQWLGGYDRATAFYAGTPGGLMESIMMGEASGADIRALTTQQFLRIIVVITVLPLGLSLWLGEAVGSASGAVLPGGDVPVSLPSLALIVITGGLGLGLGRLVKLPAAQLTGPLLLAGGATVTGLVDLHLPVWLIAAAQLVIGVSLGLRFKGVTGRMLRNSLGLAVVSVVYMLAVGAAMAWVLTQLTGIAFLHLLISFAPGGVAEMSIVALSLAANPALVSLHHVARILMTVVEMSLLGRWLRP